MATIQKDNPLFFYGTGLTTKHEHIHKKRRSLESKIYNGCGMVIQQNV